MQARQWQVPEDCLYDKENYWVKLTGDQAVIGFSDYGQYSIGDILFLELPVPGETINKGQDYGSVESGKWVGKLKAPVSGRVVEANQAVAADPRLANKEPYDRGWLLRLALTSPEEGKALLNAENYRVWVEEQESYEQKEGLGA